MRGRPAFHFLVFTLVVVAVVGCTATQGGKEYPAVETGNRLDLEYPIDSRSEQVSLTISREGRLPTAIVSGEGALARTAIEWSAQWFYPDGREIPGTSSRFRRATINAGVAFTLQATAPVAEADTVHVRIRQANNM